MIPCDVCGRVVPFASFPEHAAAHKGILDLGDDVIDLSDVGDRDNAVVDLDGEGAPGGSSGVIDLDDEQDEAVGDFLPCDVCGALISPAKYTSHVTEHLLSEGGLSSNSGQHHGHLQGAKNNFRPDVDTSSPPTLLPCEVCGDLFLPSEYRTHIQAHEARRDRNAKRHHPTRFKTPDAIAACLVESLRTFRFANAGAVAAAAASGGLGSLAGGPVPTTQFPFDGSVANFDLAVRFVAKAMEMRDQFLNAGESELQQRELSAPKVVYHWTPRKNFGSIIDTNLRVPDGRSVFHQTDSGYFGTGIYTSPDFAYGQAYAYEDGACFICLSLPGRQHLSTYPQDNGRPQCRAGFDSHMSACRGNMEWVFFDSAQLLPCYLVTQETQATALEAVESAKEELVGRL